MASFGPARCSRPVEILGGAPLRLWNIPCFLRGDFNLTAALIRTTIDNFWMDINDRYSGHYGIGIPDTYLSRGSMADAIGDKSYSAAMIETVMAEQG